MDPSDNNFENFLPDAHYKRGLRMAYDLQLEKRLSIVCRPHFQGVLMIYVDRNRMRIRKGGLRLSPNEEAQIVREETEKRRRLRIQQVREQSKENAAKIRHAVKQEKHKQLMRLATDIKDQLEAEKAERVRHLEQQYDNSLRNIGVGHKSAGQQPDYAEEKALVQQEENLRAEARGRAAAEHHRQEAAQRNFEAQKHVIARQEALAIEKARASQIAAMPAPPPDPVANVILPKPTNKAPRQHAHPRSLVRICILKRILRKYNDIAGFYSVASGQTTQVRRLA
ncbi:centrosomal protein of 295 kDa-like [Dreissena polymorpha]|uniref:centrosomal protein of 295 kDa-like n=1 Tax=Dreissena polymorpha TaxID=45954 RepID=UPI002264FB3C|nr:centrosomal protein of 295 kDa-like [Dreissena polymorpha]